MVESKFGQKTSDEYGVWVYYPWAQKLVHILDEEEFAIVRTNRNKYKITEQEQQTLATKKIRTKNPASGAIALIANMGSGMEYGHSGRCGAG